MADEWPSQLSHTLALRASSLGPPSPGSALLCCQGEVQDLLSQVLQLMRVRPSPLVLKTLWTAFVTSEVGIKSVFMSF